MKYYHTINLENLYRPRVCELLDQCMDFPLISIEAGTGFGKSIALNQYLTSYKRKNVIMRLNHLDNIPERFWMKLSRTLEKVYPEVAAGMKSISFPLSNSEINNCIHFFAKHMSFEEDICFIMDGFHLIEEPSILHFVESMLHIELDNLHVFIIAAHKHGLDLKPLYEADLVFNITKDDLGFTKQEIGEYLLQLGIEHDQDLVQSVYQFTEGWAFAIKLSAFYLKNYGINAEVSEQVLPTLFDLMDTFAYDSYSQQYKDVLIALSQLHTIPVSLVMHVTGLQFDEIMSLEESNAFIRYDVSSYTIELHKIYQKFLRSKRIGLARDSADDLNEKIADWYYQNDYVYEAMDYYRRCNNYDKVCQIVRDFRNRKLSHDMSKYLIKTIDSIPAEIKDRHRDLPLYEALFHFNNNNLTLAHEILTSYEAKLMKEEQNELSQEMLGEIYLLLGLIRMFLRKTDFHEYFKRALEKLPEGSSIFNHTYPLLEINHGLFSKTLKKSDLEQTLMAVKAGLPDFIKLSHGCGAGAVELAFGEYEFLRGNLRKAEKYLYEGLIYAKEHYQADIVLITYYMIYRINIARGNPDAALEYLDKIKNFKEQEGYPKRDYPLIDIAMGWTSLKMGTSANIPRWLLSDDIEPNDISRRNEGRNMTLYAHWLLAVKQSPSEALAYIEKLEKIFKERSIHASLVYCYLLKYTAYKMLERAPEECFKIIEKVYDLIKDADLMMFVVENGSTTRSALMAYKKYPDRRIPDEWLDRIITKSMTYSKYLNTFKLHYQKSTNRLPDVALTNSEKALLDGLCYGLSRAELAEENRITENTVKSQLKTIYNKLNAANQAEAVYIYTTHYLAAERL